MRLTKVPVVLLATLVIAFVGAAPAPAATGVLAAKKEWHFWIAPVLVASVVGMFIALGLGYLVRVTMAKYGIKVGPRRHAE